MYPWSCHRLALYWATHVWVLGSSSVSPYPDHASKRHTHTWSRFLHKDLSSRSSVRSHRVCSILEPNAELSVNIHPSLDRQHREWFHLLHHETMEIVKRALEQRLSRTYLHDRNRWSTWITFYRHCLWKCASTDRFCMFCIEGTWDWSKRCNLGW